MIKRNKKAMSIPIVLLVLLTLILITTSLFYFNIKQKNVKETMMIPDEIDRIYVKELQLNYYLQDIFDKAFEGITAENSQEQLIDNFKRELARYKVNDKFIVPEFSQIELQINREHITFENGKAIARFDIVLENKVTAKDKIIFSAVYAYEKTFEKEILFG